jgi:hypothetical protein
MINDCNTCASRTSAEHCIPCTLCACGGSGYTPQAPTSNIRRRGRTRRIMGKIQADTIRNILKDCDDLEGLDRFNLTTK